MLLPRSDSSGESCGGYSPCAYDSGLPTTDNDVSSLPNSGTYGYMGVMMVVILALLACALWLYMARRKAKRAKVREASEQKAPVSNTRQELDTGKRKSSPSLPLPVTSRKQDTEENLLPLSDDSTTKPTKRVCFSEKGKQPRWVSQTGVRKGLVKEVSGGVVLYTTPNKGSKPARPKPTAQPPRRDRDSRTERQSCNAWHMGHVSGVQYEVRTSPEGTQGTSNSAPP